MAFNVAQFRSQLVYGGARPTLFDLSLTFPTWVGNGTQKLSFMASAASIPPSQVGVIPVGYFGRQIKVPGDRDFPNWTITVINDEDFTLRDMFEVWSSGINEHVANLRDEEAYLAPGYSTDIIVTQYDKIGDSRKEYDMVGAFPANVQAIDLNWDTRNSIETFQVEFAYQWWTSRTTDR